MKREMKFRIWNGMEMVYDITTGKFGTFYVNPEKGDGLNPQDTASLTVNTTKYHEGTPLMQFTGLKDKNGKEIFEGDIWKFTSTELVNISTGEKTKHNGYRIGTIEYSDGKFVEVMRLQENSFYGELPDIGRIYVKENVAEHIEIIGNIYQNEALLHTGALAGN